MDYIFGTSEIDTKYENSKNLFYHLNFVKENPHAIIISAEDRIHENFSEFESYFNIICELYNKFYILYFNEVFTESAIEKITNLIYNKPNKEIYICHSASNFGDLFLHPIVSLLHWRGTGMRKHIGSKCDSFQLFKSENFDDTYEKTLPYIFSTRKETLIRNKIYSSLDNNIFKGIVRYARWPISYELEIGLDVSKFPTFNELLSEYKSSYISFIIESERNENINSLTEKTIIAFLTKTMPIFYNSKHYYKDLKAMGFNTFDDVFNITDEYDEEFIDSDTKIKQFVNYLNKIDTLSNDEIKDIYDANMHKIEANYTLTYRYLIKYNFNLDFTTHSF
jgi:hypothetical protein